MQITENKSDSQVNEFLVLMMWKEILRKTLNPKAFHLKLFAKISFKKGASCGEGSVAFRLREPSSMRRED